MNLRTTGMHIINAQGEAEECDDVRQWAAFMRDDNRVVAQTMVGTIKVSTVFLGLDYNLGGGPPLLWETMIFGGLLDGEMDRYYSLDSAQLGHEQTVARVKEEG